MSQTITNPRRRKRMEEFWDNDHEAMEEYYDLLEKKLSTGKMKKEMQKLIQKDPDFYDPYLIVADILESEGRSGEARELRCTAYERALRRVVDKEGNFPKRLEWGWLENRHLLRAIGAWAEELWEQGKREEALEILRELLRSNPHDNIGARHDILAIRLGLGTDYEKKFAVKDTPGYLDAFKLSEWFKKHSKKFHDEFGWWFKAVKDDG